MGFGRRRVENGAIDEVLRVDGKVSRLPDTLDVEDAQGAELCRVQTPGVGLDALAHPDERSQCVRS
jgi:uncharacterized protein YxjI